MKNDRIAFPRRLKSICRRVAAWFLILTLPAFLIFLTIRAIVTWSALRDHGETAEASVFGVSAPLRQGARGGSPGSVTYNYLFWYRGVRYQSTSSFTCLYPGRWPSPPYRVTFLPEAPEISDVLPVDRDYVVCKSAAPVCGMLLFSAIWFVPALAMRWRKMRFARAFRRPLKARNTRPRAQREPLTFPLLRKTL